LATEDDLFVRWTVIAEALGLDVPCSIQLPADEVIE
jgi:hypothetical protein